MPIAGRAKLLAFGETMFKLFTLVLAVVVVLSVERCVSGSPEPAPAAAEKRP